MDSAEARRGLQLALSHRAKALSSCEECAHELAVGIIDQARHDALHEDYQAHIKDAEAQIARLRDTVRTESVRLANELRMALDEKERLRASVRAGRTSPQAANKTARRLAARIEALRTSIAEFNALHAARTPDALGGFIDLALERYSPVMQEEPRPQPKAAPQTNRPYSAAIILLAAAAGLVIVVFLVSPIIPIGGEVRCDAKLSGSSSHTILLTCHNDRKVPITFHVLWPEGRPERSKRYNASTQYGLTLYVREEGDAQWRLMPTPEGCWRHHGLPIPGQSTFTIDPGFSLDLTLDARRLTHLGTTPQAIKLEFARSDGHLITTFQTDLAF